MMTLSDTLKKCSAGYKLSKLRGKDQPLHVNGRHQNFAKNERELENLIQTVKYI